MGTLKEWAGYAFVFVFIAVLWRGGAGFYNDLSSPTKPQMVTADGDSFVACRDVKVSEDGWFTQTFTVKYTDASGLYHVLRGVKKVELVDVPAMKEAPLISNNNLTDKDGKDYVVGTVYSNQSGEKGKFDGYLKAGDTKLAANWLPVEVPNDACPKRSASGK